MNITFVCALAGNFRISHIISLYLIKEFIEVHGKSNILKPCKIQMLLSNLNEFIYFSGNG